MGGREALAGECRSVERRLQGDPLALDDRRRDMAVRACPVAGEALGEGQVEHDRERRDAGRVRSPHEGPPGVGAHVRGVHHARPTGGQPTLEGGVQGPERSSGRGLVGLAPPEACPEVVGREDLGGREVTRRERRLAGPGGTDQHHQAGLGDVQIEPHGPMMAYL